MVPERQPTAQFFARAIGRSREGMNHKGHFYSDQQRREVAELFKAGQDIYQRLGGSK
ncbi:MAG: hypothetical protein HY328_11900 [Chloroflexi bacterium]|nr:hypothetical protein [Chloroflexota bacterium]